MQSWKKGAVQPFCVKRLILLDGKHGSLSNKFFNLEETIRCLRDKMRKETENWFKQAKADLKTAGDCLKTKNYYASAFFSPQSLEKTLKALFLVERNETPPKTHNLLDLCLELKVPEEYLSIARELTPEFIITRYPDAAGGAPFELYDKKTALDILNKTERFFSWLQKRIE